jgi:hypothetical protein
MLPACGSVGLPVCCCQRPWSRCVTSPVSPFGSPFRAGSTEVPSSVARVGSAPCAFESAYRNSKSAGGTWRLTVAIPNGANGTM